MLNIFNYYDNPRELDRFDLLDAFFIIEKLKEMSLTQSDKDKLEQCLPIIKKDPEAAYRYAIDILKGRFPEAERYMVNDPWVAHRYAKNVIKGRWKEAEPVIMNDLVFAYMYARDIIKGRWEEAEPTIKKDDYYWGEYQKIPGVQ